MQQALLTAVMFHLNVFAQHGTRLQVTFAQLVTIVLKAHFVLSLVNLVSTVHMLQWPHHKETALQVITVMTVQLFLISLTVQWDTIVHQELVFQFPALQESFQILLGT